MYSLVVRLVQSVVEAVKTVPAAVEVKLTETLGLASGQMSAVVAQLATAAMVAELFVTAEIVMGLAGVVVQAVSEVVVESVVTTAAVVVVASFAVIVIKLQRSIWSVNEKPNGFLD